MSENERRKLWHQILDEIQPQIEHYRKLYTGDPSIAYRYEQMLREQAHRKFMDYVVPPNPPCQCCCCKCKR